MQHILQHIWKDDLEYIIDIDEYFTTVEKVEGEWSVLTHFYDHAMIEWYTHKGHLGFCPEDMSLTINPGSGNDPRRRVGIGVAWVLV